MTEEKPTLSMGASIEDKIKRMNQAKTVAPQAVEPQEVEVIKRLPSSSEVEHAMKRYNLVKPKKGARVDIDEDLHCQFKIMAIRLGKTQKDWLHEIILDAVEKAEKKFGK